MKMVAEIDVSHPYETKAPTTTEVTLQSAIEAPATCDMKVTPLVEIEVTAPASRKSSAYTD